MILVISGPSGVGKSTIINNLNREDGLYFSVSYTTRPIRKNEKHGVDYFFVDKEIFDRMVKESCFVEYEEYGGYMYGTSIDELSKVKDKKGIILDLEVNGAIKVLSKYSNSVGIFVDIDNTELLSRLKLRGHSDEQFLKTRIDLASKQRAEKGIFEYYILNKEINDTVNEINDIIYNRIL